MNVNGASVLPEFFFLNIQSTLVISNTFKLKFQVTRIKCLADQQ